MLIEGDLHLGLSLIPTVAVDGVSFSNAAWGTQPQMAKVKSIEVKVALLPLLSGDILVERLILIEPDIFIETDAEGHGNWVFGESLPERTARPEDKAAASGLAAVGVREIEISEGHFRYRAGDTGHTTLLVIDRLSAGADDTNSPLKLDLAGAELPPLGPMEVSARLLDSEAGYQLEGLKARVGKTDVSGRLAAVLTGERPRVEAQLTSTNIDLADFTTAAGDAVAPEKDEKTQQAKRVFPDDPLPLDGLRSVDADVTLRADRVTARGLPLQNVDLKLALDGGRLLLKPVKAQVAGTLAEPRLELNPAGVLKQGVSVTAAVATNGLSTLATRLFDEATKDEHPCLTAQRKPAPTSASTGKNETVQSE
jgi:uncharacterized protein involved in outer membrane biogenesis